MLPVIPLTLAGRLAGKKITHGETLWPLVFQNRSMLCLGAPRPQSEGSWCSEDIILDCAAVNHFSIHLRLPRFSFSDSNQCPWVF